MRFRFAAALAALVLLVILIQALVMLTFLHTEEEAFIDQQLEQQIEHSMEVARRSPGAVFPNTPAMWMYRVARGESADKVPAMMAGLPIGTHEVYLGSKEYRVVVREDDVARYILAYDVEDHESRLGHLVLIVCLAGVALAFLTLFAGYFLADRLTRQMVRLAGRVERDAPGSFVEPGMDRELHAVAEALDHYRQRQLAMLTNERAFAANLSHELRTPLTGIRTDAELLAALPDLPDSVVRRGRRIVASVDRIDGLASSLLLLAREEKPKQIEEIALQAAIETVWKSLLAGTPKSLSLNLEIPPATTVLADPSLFELVIRNLLDNALRYSESGAISCRLEGSRLCVRDNGPGFGEGDLDMVFERFFVGPRGVHGIGLALVHHVCTVSGWQVAARNAEGGGGEVMIDFGTALAGSQFPHNSLTTSSRATE